MNYIEQNIDILTEYYCYDTKTLESGIEKFVKLTNVMSALPNIGGALCSTPQFDWCRLPEYRAATLKPLKFVGVPQAPEPISAAGAEVRRIVETCGGDIPV